MNLKYIYINFSFRYRLPQLCVLVVEIELVTDLFIKFIAKRFKQDYYITTLWNKTVDYCWQQLTIASPQISVQRIFAERKMYAKCRVNKSDSWELTDGNESPWLAPAKYYCWQGNLTADWQRRSQNARRTV